MQQSVMTPFATVYPTGMLPPTFCADVINSQTLEARLCLFYLRPSFFLGQLGELRALPQAMRPLAHLTAFCVCFNRFFVS
jgi:hypothetical protein